ncbi:MAG TPA: tripartite tricarboxylate transporter substrate binding protein [Burkholderiales bacterium]|nr:tripartite tricarboxylate transporter substrate binding protein [Burkholderiales bacterium]
MRVKHALLRGLAACVALACAAAAAQTRAPDYPTRSIRIVVPLSPGGSGDINARMFSAWLEERFKQAVIVDNRPGGGTIIGTDFVVRSPADGYTLLVAAQNVSYLNLTLKETNIQIKDFSPIGIISGGGYVLMVSSSVPAKTLRELVAYSKANPGKLNYGMAGGTALPEVEELRLKLGLDLTHVAYKGGSQVVQAFSTGEVHFFPAGVYQAIPLVKDGKGRAVAYTERYRYRSIPDVPTVGESGVGAPDFDAHFWIGVLGPAGLPRDIVTRLNSEVLHMIQSPEVLGRLRNLAYNTYPMTPDEMRADMEKTRKLVADLVARGVIKTD